MTLDRETMLLTRIISSLAVEISLDSETILLNGIMSSKLRNSILYYDPCITLYRVSYNSKTKVATCLILTIYYCIIQLRKTSVNSPMHFLLNILVTIMIFAKQRRAFCQRVICSTYLQAVAWELFDTLHIQPNILSKRHVQVINVYYFRRAIDEICNYLLNVNEIVIINLSPTTMQTQRDVLNELYSQPMTQFTWIGVII